MNLDDAQRKKVVEWIGEGLKLSDIQSRLASEFGLTLTYMDVRFLVDDLKLTPKDPEPPAPPPAPPTPVKAAAPQEVADGPIPPDAIPIDAPAGGKVTVTVDKLTRPGAFVSGKVSFSDGNQADWHLDQTGRLGLVPQKAGYRPPAADVDQFRAALEAELAKLGL